MINLYAVWTIARYEAKLLFRSWSFRIFSLLGLVILAFMDIGLGTTLGRSPYYMYALSSSLPLMNLKLLNVYQGIIAAFLATEFIKRDRRHDTTQVVFARSFSNAEYLLGKVAGILVVFAGLNLAALSIAFIIHVFFSPTAFAWQPYILYPLFISVPTLVFITGVSFLLVTVLRSQAVVFVIMLGYSLLVLILLGPHLFYIFDFYAFFQPLIYSDIIGLGNRAELLLVRGAYLFCGFGFMALTVLFSRRLRQSPITTATVAVTAVVFLFAATAMGFNYLQGKFADRDYRRLLQEASAAVHTIPTITVDKYNIHLRHAGEKLAATAKIAAVNQSTTSFDSLLFTLNPGLTVSEVSGTEGQLPFRREGQLLWIKPEAAIAPGDSIRLTIMYSGAIDERFCYLDVENDRHEARYRMWVFSIPKHYAFVQPGFLHLTPEVCWYPIPGLSPGAAFPAATGHSFAKYTLAVDVPDGLIAVSQGKPDSTIDSGRLRCTFQPETRLPGISLTLGNYQTRRITVDTVTYSLYTFPGHDYFMPFFDEVTDTLPHIIRELKNEYEIALGLEYPYRFFSLVEVPIQFYSDRRLWTVAQEMGQPQMVFLPELGTICAGTNFQRMKRRGTRRQERANQADSPAEIQSGYFTTFVKTDLLGMQADRWSIRQEANIEPRYEILPNYLSYTTRLSSERWPVLNYALESYFQMRVIPPPEESRWFRWRGLNDREKANLALKQYSLADLLGKSPVKTNIRSAALATKGQYLLSYLEANVGAEHFGDQLADFLNDRRFRDISDRELIEFTGTLGEVDPADMIDSWYYDTLLPGYQMENIESFDVIDGEYTRTQIKFQVTNPTRVDGVIRVDFRYRRREANFGPRWMRGQNQSDYTEMILVPAKTTMEVGIVIDQPPAEMTVETFASRNIPSVFRVPFREQKLRRFELPFAGIVTTPIDEATMDEISEYLVDNEDTGFELLSHTRENWFRRTLLGLFKSDEERERYTRVRFWDPPDNWQLTTSRDFYGEFVHSGYCKKAGDGQYKVAWAVELGDPGDYDIYYYYEGPFEGPRWFHRRRGGSEDAGQRHFLVYHDDGVEDLPLDLNGAEEGWNYLGTYRLSAGENRIELTDENETEFVTADAVKWVKR